MAATAREQALALGCVGAEVLCVDVGEQGGPEAAARSARYRALDTARSGAQVLLGHTLDDQAETVLLGLGRGSGARSIAGMRPHDPPWCRPLLGVRREVTHRACAVRCLSGGIPALFVVRDADGSAVSLLLTGRDGRALNGEILDLVAEPLVVRGAVERQGALLLLRAEPGDFRRE